MMNGERRLVISKGSDQFPIVDLLSRKTGRYFDLTNVTNIEFHFTKKDRSTLILDMSNIPATKALKVVDGITFIASSAGANGNSIQLTFNGVDTVDEIIQAWNDVNPANTVSHNGQGDEILESQTFNLDGGYNPYQAVSVFGNPIEGRVQLNILEKYTNLLRVGNSQSFKVVIDVGLHPGGVRAIGRFEQKLDVIGD